MKVGDIEVPDTALEAALKAAGRRVVEQTEFEKAMSAAADLAKFRKVTGEGRPIEEIEKMVKAYEEAEKKNKTQTELLMAEVKRLQENLQAKEGEVKKAALEVKKRDIKAYFDEAMAKNNIKVIEPILAPIRDKFLEVDESTTTPESVKDAVGKALLEAQEIQKGELLRLGINGISPEPSGPSFGAGFTNITSKTPPSFQANSEVDLFAIMRETSATPLGVPIGKPPQK